MGGFQTKQTVVVFKKSREGWFSNLVSEGLFSNLVSERIFLSFQSVFSSVFKSSFAACLSVFKKKTYLPDHTKYLPEVEICGVFTRSRDVGIIFTYNSI